MNLLHLINQFVSSCYISISLETIKKPHNFLIFSRVTIPLLGSIRLKKHPKLPSTNEPLLSEENMECFLWPRYSVKDYRKKINLGTVKMSGYYYSSQHQNSHRQICRSIHPEVFLEKGVLKICSRFTREHPWRSVISINHTSPWVFSCKFAAYFQNTFF